MWFRLHHDTCPLMSGVQGHTQKQVLIYDDVIKWKRFPRHGPFVRGIHRWPVNYPHKGQWREALILSLICAGINGWVNNDKAGDLRRHRAHYDVTVMWQITVAINNVRELLACAYLTKPSQWLQRSWRQPIGNHHDDLSVTKMSHGSFNTTHIPRHRHMSEASRVWVTKWLLWYPHARNTW